MLAAARHIQLVRARRDALAIDDGRSGVAGILWSNRIGENVYAFLSEISATGMPERGGLCFGCVRVQ